MSQLILNVLCEGDTEESFAKSVLKEHLKSFDIVAKPITLCTNKKRNIKGGIISYQQAKNDLDLLMKQHSKKTYEKHFYTTIFNLYALPNDFPGYEEAIKIQDCYALVTKLEEEFRKDINHDRFIPYIQLHEFEALVFCGLEHLLVDYPEMVKEVEKLKILMNEYEGNPEKINNSPETAPSKRIIKAFGSKEHYNKVKSGKLVTDKVGIHVLKEKCPHFREWIDCLDGIG